MSGNRGISSLNQIIQELLRGINNSDNSGNTDVSVNISLYDIDPNTGEVRHNDNLNDDDDSSYVESVENDREHVDIVVNVETDSDDEETERDGQSGDLLHPFISTMGGNNAYQNNAYSSNSRETREWQPTSFQNETAGLSTNNVVGGESGAINASENSSREQIPISSSLEETAQRTNQLTSLMNMLQTLDNTSQQQTNNEQRRRYTVLLNNIILAYNENMLEYQRNINDLIRIANTLNPVHHGGNGSQTQFPQLTQLLQSSLNSLQPPPRQPPRTRPPSQHQQQSPQQLQNQSTFSYISPLLRETRMQRESRINGIIQQLRNRTIVHYPDRTNIYMRVNGLPDIFSLLSGEESVNRQPFTQSEVNQITRLAPYQSTMGETRCPISLEDFEEGEMVRQINRCGHIFNARILEEWLTSSSMHICCPICRCDLRSSTVGR